MPSAAFTVGVSAIGSDDALNTTVTAIAGTETGSGVEAVIRISTAGAETGSGLDNSTLTTTTRDTETGSGLDAVVSIGRTQADASSASVDASTLVKYEAIRPDGDILVTGWTDQAGGTTTLFTTVDEPIDSSASSDADYIKATLA